MRLNKLSDNEDRSQVDVMLAEEPVAQIAPHNVGSDTHILAYVQFLGLGKWCSQLRMSC